MKIIHCSDLHLDADLKTNFDAASASGRRAELLDTFRRLCRTARDEKVTAILICGDLFDTGSPSPSAVRFVEDLILTYGEICFFYLRGNHDARSALFENRTKPDNLFYFGSTWTHWALPPGRQGERPVCITGMEPGSASFTPPLLDHRSLNIVMLHGQVIDGYSATGEESVPLGALAGRGIDYLALGHLHHYRTFALDSRGTAAYSGCLEGRGFDECGECGYVLIQIDPQSARLTSRFVPFASRRLYRTSCDVTGLVSDMKIYEQITKALESSPASDRDLVRLELTGELEYGCSPDLSVIREDWEGRFHYFDCKDSTCPVVHSEDFLCDATLKGEFVRIVNAADSLSSEEKTQVLRCGLRALSGDTLF